MPALKPCLGCGRLSTNGTRCPDCARTRGAATTRVKRERRPYTSIEQRRRAQAVRDHVVTYGHWCPGYMRGAHYTPDLTADHAHAVAAGGAEDQALTVLCRSCNARKGAR